ncbi:hypothetical protein MXM84_02330 [Acinetobacter pittii]|uniref:DUF7946 domain-containing protein n=1 Tax=Acinetobacter pittii TaxID=48296 RepID=UPI002DBB4089|nr:hypothetical protein [Acinetobacter pittii]MEB6623346.1 hypothetical protein [Acinetobacter pittii]
MNSKNTTLKFKIAYQNGIADQHHLDMYDAAISYLGFAKALNITIGAILNKQVKVKGNNSGGIKVYLETSKKGSFEQFVTIIIENPSLTASTIVLGASGSALWEGIKFVWGGLLNQVQPKPSPKMMDRIEPILGELHQALETPLQEAHRPVTNDEALSVEISCGRKQGLIKLDESTLKVISEKRSDKIEDNKIGNITKYNHISHIGRYYDEALDKTIPFHSEALTKYEQELLTWSLHESNKDINQGKLKISAIPIKTVTGKLKRYDFVDIKKV